MGSLLSQGRRMNDTIDSAVSSDNNNADRDRDIATFLQFLIRSGQVRIIASASSQMFNDDSDEECFSGTPPKIDQYPDTSCLNGSDISQAILLNSGALNDRHLYASSGANSLPYMLRMRETGMNGRQQFSRGDKCQIYQKVLPNKMNILDRYMGKVFCGTFARQGDVFISAAQDYFIRLYDTSQGLFKLSRTVEARDVGWSILDTAVSPDGCKFIYCSWSECIHMCNLTGDYDVHEALPLDPDERRFCLFSLSFSHDGTEILGGANDRCLYVYNREKNKRTLRISSHADDVNTVAFADSTSQILFSGGDDALCKVWDRRTLCESNPKPVGILAGHEDGITYVDSKGDGRHLITNSKDQTIKLWDMRAFSSCGGDINVSKPNWDYRWQKVPQKLNRYKEKMQYDTSLMTYRGHSVLQTLIRCHFSPEATTGQSYIYTGCAQGRVVIYDILTGKIVTTLRGHKGCVRDVAWHPYRNEIMSSSWDGTVGKWTFNKTEIDSDSEDIDMSSSNGRSESSVESQCLRRSQRLADQRRRQEMGLDML